MKKALGAVLCLVVAGCGNSAATSGAGGSGGTGGGGSSGSSGGGPACGPEQSGCLEFSHKFDDHKLQPGFESDTVCESWTLNNADEIFVNSVSFQQTGGYHHSNWYFVPNTMFNLPDGTWDCNEQKLDGLQVAVAGGVLYGQSIDVPNEVTAYPDGVAIRIPPWSRVIGVNHLINPNSSDITANVQLTVKALPKADVKTQLVPFRMIYHDLHVTPQAKSEFQTDCDFQTAQGGKAFSANLYYIQAHYHQAGIAGKLWTKGGPGDGTVLAEFGPGPAGRVLSPPLAIQDAMGLSWSCTYSNPTDKELVWDDGNYKQEMCFWFGFIDGQKAFAGEVSDGQNQAMGMSGDTLLNSGKCGVLAVTWKDKPGGMPPM
jgi:hypothetical protein